jgi:23S rRNA pseudouridine2605 synthase
VAAAGPVRLQKYLASAGVASRRAAELLIAEGRVRVNGSVVAEPGVKVAPGRDRVEVDGRTVVPARAVWIALHKPRGYLTTRADPGGRRTVYQLLPPEHAPLFYVGRLDRDSEGLLILTNQGDAANLLLHPRYEVERVYEAEVEGVVSRDTIRQLLQGVELEDGVARAARVEKRRSARDDRDRLRLTLTEGRNREVRRLLGEVGHPVRRLIRLRYGPIRLGHLPAGEWRPLTAPEVAAIMGDADTGAHRRPRRRS